MLANMTSREFTEWEEFYKMEPFGELRADIRAGMMTAPLINMWRKPSSTPVHPSRWIYDADTIGNKITDPDAIKLAFQALAAAMKGKPKKKKKHKKKQRRK